MSPGTSRQHPAQSGAAAEALACRYLQARGLRLVKRNYRCRRGEVDLIMEEGDRLVFVEVRYRRGNAFGSALESVTGQKQARIAAAAAYFLQRERRTGQACRFDVLAVSGEPPGAISWVKDAFQLAG